jgi:DNA-binding GntR family transcriptional regulator
MPIPTGQPEQHQRVLLRDMVRGRIREAIMDGTLRPGEFLQDDALQSWFGVSRTPIRDAVNELSRMGLIEMSPNRYTRVATPSDADALSAFNTLGVLLAGVVRVTVPQLSAVERKRIASSLQKLAATARDSDFDRVRTPLVTAFERFVSQCENSQLTQVCSDTLDGLAFKIRADRMAVLVDQEVLASALEALAKATLAGRAVDAELATGRVFLLPGE